MSVVCRDPVASSVEELFAAASVHLSEHFIELVPSLDHAVDEGGKALAHLGHHRFHQRETNRRGSPSAVIWSVPPNASLALVSQP